MRLLALVLCVVLVGAVALAFYALPYWCAAVLLVGVLLLCVAYGVRAGMVARYGCKGVHQRY